MKFLILTLSVVGLVVSGMGCGQDSKTSGVHPAPVAPSPSSPNVSDDQNKTTDLSAKTLQGNPANPDVAASLAAAAEALSPEEALQRQYGNLAYAFEIEDAALRKAIKEKNTGIKLGPEFGKAVILSTLTIPAGYDGLRRMGFVGKEWTDRMMSRSRIAKLPVVGGASEEVSTASRTDQILESVARPSKIVGAAEFGVALLLGSLAVGEWYKWGKDFWYVEYGSTPQVLEHQRKVELIRRDLNKAYQDMHVLAVQKTNGSSSSQ